MLGAVVTGPAPAPGPAWSTVLTTWRTTWGVELVVTALAAVYLRTVVHVGGWPVLRTVSSVGALAIAVVAVDSGVGVFAPRSFPVGVVMQLLLTTVVPVLWVAGRPVELLRRGCSERVAAWLDWISGAVRAVASPLVALVVYALVAGLTRLTAFPVAVASSPVLSVVQQLAWVAAGVLFFHAALGRASYTVRLLLLVAGTAVTVAVGGVLAASPAGWTPTFPPDDVHLGGTVLWAAGGGLLLVITAALGVRALRDGGR